MWAELALGYEGRINMVVKYFLGIVKQSANVVLPCIAYLAFPVNFFFFSVLVLFVPAVKKDFFFNISTSGVFFSFFLLPLRLMCVLFPRLPSVRVRACVNI